MSSFPYVSLSAAAVSLLASCATMPDAAPAELHAAARAVHAAELAGAADVAPHSFKLAERDLKDAVALNDRHETAHAIALARQAEAVATRSMHLAQDVKDWDGGDLLSYERFRQAEQELATLRAGAPQKDASPDVDTAPLAIAQPIAFFDTAAAAVVDSSQPALNELVQSLKADPALRVRLVGHADRRGGETYNDKLARERVVAVASYLTEQGIEPGRIRILSRGAHDAAAEDRDLGRLQLDRRVDAQVASDAPAANANVAH